ncbi:MAG: hypothetical protein KC502_19230, partial [Myxococcales bacterium]|nr:hypothetical protein [Myxococcales bacterium]
MNKNRFELLVVVVLTLALVACGQPTVEAGGGGTGDTGTAASDAVSGDSKGGGDATTDVAGEDVPSVDTSGAADVSGDPGLLTLCDPCTLSSQCGAAGDSSARCVDHDGNGAFCAMACAGGSGCPLNYTCRSVTTMEGTKASQCVPTGKDADTFGSCHCSTESIEAGKKTTCSMTSSVDGKSVTCYGERKCEKLGLSKCSATAPSKEVCDGLDNDCNGSTDDGSCDDGDACTVDKCDPKTGKCTSSGGAGACDDGNPCTVGEKCTGGKCAGGLSNACDDKNGCTTDSCDPKTGCKNVAIPNCKGCTSSSQCNDNNPCTTDYCSNKSCVFTPKSCDDGDSCTTDTCAQESGKCSSAFDKKTCGGSDPLKLPFKASFGCGDASTALWTLNNGVKGPGWAFDDTPAKPIPAFKPCTLNFNNGTDFQCVSGMTSVSGSVLSPWLDAKDVPSVGNLRMRVRYGGTWEQNNNDELHFQVTTDGISWQTVYDANAMSSATQWSQPNINLSSVRGKLFRVRILFSTNSCKVNTGTGPFIDQVWVKDDACYSNDDCKTTSKCSLMRCWNKSCQGINPCNDNNACTSDSCNSADGSCKHTALKTGNACNDGDSCTKDTKCASGSCTGGSKLADGVACEDGNGCTPKGACKGGSCDATVTCDDNNACTVDTCDTLLNKCSFQPAAGTCNDGNPCTAADACTKGLCLGKPNACDDGNACTADKCLKASGKCTHEATVCDDNNSCTVDSCNKGTCSHKADNTCATNAKLPYLQPFDCGTATGWQYTGVTGGPTWAVDGTPAVPKPFTGKCTLNFNNGTNFTCPAGKTKVEGTATSPWIDATAAQTTYMRLRFRMAGNWEANNDDEFYVEATTNGTSWSKIWDASSTNPTNWQYPQLGLSQYKGKKFRLRFRFVTKDCNDNGGTGPFVDDLRVEDLGCVVDKDCDDDNKCTTHTCNSNGYCSNEGTDCNDKNPCTSDVCNAATGKCENNFLPDTYGCSDGNACTVSDKCHAGKCAGYANPCDDGNKCTKDACDEKTGCTYKPVCDDGNACTLDTCDAQTQKCGAQNLATGSACEDGDACTGAEFCGAKGCVGGVVTVGGGSTSFSTVSDVAVHSNGTVYFTSIGYHRIYRLNGTSGTIVAGSSSGFADGKGTAARFSSPRSLDIDKSGNLIVADSSNHRIRRVDTSGNVTTLAGSKAGYKEGAGGLLNNPYGVAVDSKGAVWVADTYNYKIRRLGSGGAITTVAGSSGGFVDGQGTKARFNRPMGIDFDGKGNLIIADAYNYRIRKMTPGGLVTTVAGTGQSGFIDGVIAAARFNRPWDVQVAAGGSILVGDAYNYRVRRITPTGIVATLAGQQSGGFTNGPGVLARFNRPTGIAVHSDGTVYVADMYNGRIRTLKVSPGDGKSLCDDGNACTIDACDKVKGACSHTPKSTCDDGKKCTTDSCNPTTGSCVNAAKNCDDGDSCTADSCDAGSGDCKHVAGTCTTKVSKDGYKQSFTCGAKSLQGWTLTGSGGPKWAVDKTPAKPAPVSPDCSLNFNNGTDYQCASGAKSVSGTATSPWLDATGGVAGAPIRLKFRYSGRWETNNNDEMYVELSKDGTSWSKIWDSSWTSTSWGTYNGMIGGYSGIKFKLRFSFKTTDCKLNGWAGPFIDDLVLIDESCKKASDCSDGNACTKDSCNTSGGCYYNGINCNDGNACSNDYCDKNWGCKYTYKAEGSSCSDGDTCTTSDSCQQKKCVGTASGKDGSLCSDSSNCTGGDKCANGKCQGTGLCHDGNPCTTDSCTPGKSCKFVLDPKVCDDGKPCTKDACNSTTGKCSNTAACDDGDTCTTDSCDAKTGACTFSKGTCTSADKPKLPWKAGFQCGTSGASQWTFQSVSGGYGWAIDKSPAVPKPVVGDCSLNLNDGTKLACKSGHSKIVAYAVSPWLDASAIPKLDNRLRVRFRQSGTMPHTGRIFRLEATTNGTSWTNIYNMSSYSPTSWGSRVASLQNYAGGLFRLRFRFEMPCSKITGTGPFIDAIHVFNERCHTNSDCDDSNPCTDYVCVNGSCSNKGVNCNDDNACTYDSCNTSLGGCQNIPRTDNYSCGSTGGCVENRCMAGVCTQKKKAEGQACSDGDTCITGGKCASGACKGQLSGKTGQACSDGNRCTTDDRCGSAGCTGKVGMVTTVASISNPAGLAFDPKGQLFISSYGSNRIYMRNTTGTTTSYAGSTAGFLDGPRTKARFYRPWGLAMGTKGELYIADSYNNRIRKIDAAGNVTTLAGGSQGFLDGKGAAAKFYRPHGVATDKSGNVFVADTYNNRIRRVSATGVVITLAGSTAGYT